MVQYHDKRQMKNTTIPKNPRILRIRLIPRILLAIWLLPRTIAIAAISLYQATLSPDHGLLKPLHPYGFCRHEPTCSEYAKKMLRERGLVIGMSLGIWRILHCAPWTKPDDAKIRKVIAA